jgi:hypothetical protein
MYPMHVMSNVSSSRIFTHWYVVLTTTLGAVSLYTVYRTVETLEFSAILVFTGCVVTHVSILTSDISSSIHIPP